MFNDNKEWLESLKEGDKVAIDVGNYSYRNYQIYTIERITPTRIIKIGNWQFDQNGRQKGKRDSWTVSYRIQPITKEIHEFVQRKNLVAKLNKIEFSKLSLEQLKQIVDIAEQKKD